MHSINPFYRNPEVLSAIKKAFKEQRMVALKDFAQAEVKGKWEESYIPDRHRYETHQGIPLQEDIASFTWTITGKRPLHEGVRRFSHGSYTILHDNDIQEPGILALLFLEDWREEWGGKLVLMKDGETIASFVPQKDTLLIFERKKGERYFIKYVNSKAGKRSLRIVG